MATILGDFSSIVCQYGLRNLSFVFSRVMPTIFSSIRGEFMDFFLDDIIIYSSTFDEHISHIEDVLHKLRMADFTCGRPSKTFLCKKKIEYLGFVITKDGIDKSSGNRDKISSIPYHKKYGM